MEPSATISPKDLPTSAATPLESKNQSQVKTESTKDSPKTSVSNQDISKDDKTSSSSQNFDVSTPCWFYMDSNGLRQGPFSLKEMFLWWKGGYFPDDLLVKTVWEDQFQMIGHIPEFYNASTKILEKIEKEQQEDHHRGIVPSFYEPPMVPNYSEQELPPQLPGVKMDNRAYSVSGNFNPTTGKFQKEDNTSHFASKGLSMDRESRMMSHYFDLDQYQQQMQAAKDVESGKKKKLVKGTKKFWKERKEKKKRAKLVAEYLAD